MIEYRLSIIASFIYEVALKIKLLLYIFCNQMEKLESSYHSYQSVHTNRIGYSVFFILYVCLYLYYLNLCHSLLFYLFLSLYIWLNVWESELFVTWQFFTNNFSSRGSTEMVELWKSFSQLCREIYISVKLPKTVRERKKNRKKQPKILPPFLLA